MTQAEYNSALSIYNPNGGYRVGKIYDVRDSTPTSSSFLDLNIIDHTPASQSSLVVETTEVFPDSLSSDKTYKMTAILQGFSSQIMSSVRYGVTEYNYSVYAKQGTARYLVLTAYTGPATYFDLATGTVTSGSGVISLISNGWYRCSINQAHGHSDFATYLDIATSPTSRETFDKAGKYLYLFGLNVNKTQTLFPYSRQPKFDLIVSGGGGTRINKLGYVENVQYNKFADSQFMAFLDTSSHTVSRKLYSAPDGTTNASQITVGSLTYIQIRQLSFNVEGQVCNISVYFKNVNNVDRNISIAIGNNGATFNGLTGAFVSIAGTGVNPLMENVGNGWWRISTGISSTSNGNFVVQMSPVSTGEQYQFWGLQATLGSTEAIPIQITTGTAAFPKIDHSAGQASFLSETVATNRILHSNDFTQTAWIKRSVEVTPNFAISPDGTNNATKLKGTVAGADIYTGATSEIGVISLWLKHLSGSNVISVAASSNGAITTTLTLTSEWVRYSLPFGVAASGIHIRNFTLNQEILIYGTQQELGSIPTSYIPTTTAIVTRPAMYTRVEFGGANIINDVWAFAEFEILNLNVTGQQPFGISGSLLATSAPRAASSIKWSGTEWIAYSRPSNTVQEDLPTGITVPRIKAAINPTTKKIIINGTVFTTIAGGISNGGYNQLTLGVPNQSGSWGVSNSNCRFYDVRVIPTSATTEADMITLTTIGPLYLMDSVPGALKIFSFRKLKSSSTKAIKAYRLADSASMDIGWDGDVIDEAALVTFSQGGDVVYEWYNQVNDLLEAVIHINGLTEIPYIVRGGVVEKQGGRVTNWWKDGRNRDSTRCNLRTTMNDETNVSIFTVFDAKDKGDLYHISVINGLNDTLYDVWQMNNTGAATGDLNLTRLKNNVPFTPTNRDDYYRNYILGSGLMLMEHRTVSMLPLNSNHLYWTLVNGNGSLDPTPTTRPEVIIMDNSVTYDANIIANDIINYYNLDFQPQTLAFMDSIGVANDTSPTVYAGINGSQLWTIMNDYITSLKTAGLLDLISVDYPMVGGTAANHAINLMDPSYGLVTWYGTWVHDALGILGNGNNTYGDIGIGHNLMRVIEGTSNGGTAVVGTNNTPVRGEALEIGMWNSASGGAGFAVGSRVNAFGNVGGGMANRHGTWLLGTTLNNAMGIQTVVRTSQADNAFYKNGILEHSTTGADSTSVEDLGTRSLYIGGYNNGGPYLNCYTNQRIQGIIIHKGLNATQVAQLRDIINVREAALNRKTW